MTSADVPHEGSLTEAISAAMVELYGRVYGHDRTIANTYVNDDVVVCILERILTTDEMRLVAAFMSANQTSPGIASELFFLEPRGERLRTR